MGDAATGGLAAGAALEGLPAADESARGPAARTSRSPRSCSGARPGPTCWRSTATPASSTRSAMPSPATGSPCSPRSRPTSSGSSTAAEPAQPGPAAAPADRGQPAAAARALRAADRGQPPRPGARRLPHLRGAARLLRPLGQPGRRARPARLRRRDAPTGSRSPTASAPRSSSPSTGRTSPRTTGAGRVYLPAEDLERFGVAPAELAGGATTPQLRRLLAFEVDARPPAPRRGRTARRPPARAGADRRRRATSAAAGRRSTRSPPPATTCSPGPPRAGRARRAGATLTTFLRRPMSLTEIEPRLRALPPRRPGVAARASTPGMRLLAGGPARRALRDLRPRAPDRRHRRRRARAGGEARGARSRRGPGSAAPPIDDPVLLARRRRRRPLPDPARRPSAS